MSDPNRRRHFLKQAVVAAGGGLLASPGLSAPKTRGAGRGSGSTGGAALDVRRFGARADGLHDDAPAIQKTLDQAGLTGAAVLLPEGRYRLEHGLNVPASVSLVGVFQAPPRSIDAGGTVLLALSGKGQEAGTPCLTLHTNSTVRGLAVFYPEQTTDILPYPPAIQGAGDNCSIVDTLLVNPYYGVDFGTRPCGRHWIKSLYMHALHRGIYVAECFDVGRIEDVHIWPFWRDDPKIHDYVSHHAEAFVLGKTDWEYMSNCFSIFYNVRYRFISSASGPGNVVLTQCGADEGFGTAPVRSVVVEAVQGHAGVSFVNSQFMSAQHIEVQPANSGPVKFSACGFWGEAATASVAMLHGSGQVSFDNCHFTGWAQAGDGHAPAIVADHGGLSVIGCDFMDAGKQQIELHEGVDAAAIVGNRLRGGAKIANSSKGSVAITANV